MLLESFSSAERTFEDAVQHGSTGTEVAGHLERAPRVAEERQVAATLNRTAKDIKTAIGGMKVGALASGIAGQAYQGQEGSSVIDVAAAYTGEQAGSLVDVSMLMDVADHEERHEMQSSSWNAGAVDIGNGQILTRLQVSEADAMSVQSTVQFVSAEYKQIYAYVFGIASKGEVARAAATGDLQGLGEHIRERRGVSADEQAARYRRISVVSHS